MYMLLIAPLHPLNNFAIGTYNTVRIIMLLIPPFHPLVVGYSYL